MKGEEERSEWKLHRLECQVLSRLDHDKRKSLTPSIRLMLRLHLRRKLQNDKIVPSTAMDNYNLVEALVACILFITIFTANMSDITEEQLVLYAKMANLVNSILQWPEINIKEIAENFSKFACNAHTICDSELRPVGTGLYPVISIINHSCLPNSVLVFEGRSALVPTVQHIPTGTEFMFNTHLFMFQGADKLYRDCWKHYDSTECSKEQYLLLGEYDDIQESAILEGYKCKSEKCGGFLLYGKGFQCQGCGLVRDKEEIKRITTEIKLLSEEKIISSSTCNYQEAISIYKWIEKLQTELYHPLSVNLMQNREKILKSLMELEHWAEALAYCKLTIPFYQRVYPAVHPLLGLQYYTCGKLEWYLGDTDEAVKSLIKAVDILRITHGTNTPFMKDLLMKLEEARAEASYRLSPKE
ncbi:Histone-lysine N-methyltransferase ASHR1 [Glycine soja]|uniref:Histone-lysine N-methyltransferase ASHR1 n=1 Tax=Glycine soja TaxID=3848 RepID=A0A445K7W9_GLYSO|nr:Histone-lysine N-methyltransferase ASHR1 [Glycine soja]